MHIDVLTLFPKMFAPVLGESIVKRAQAKGAVTITVHNLRDWTKDRHRSADDKPFGGGPGMVMMVEPVYRALEALKALPADRKRRRAARTIVLLMTPQGEPYAQPIAKVLARAARMVLICGHYEGVDERIRELVDREISIGDYVLTGGELPAMVVIDSVVRLMPGVLGAAASLARESFEEDLLEHPQYTRPAVFNGREVPAVLLGGDHKKIEAWRTHQAHLRTHQRRPDLLARAKTAYPLRKKG